MSSALLLGSEPRIVVPLARSLHKQGIPVIVAAEGPGGPCARSRAVTRFVRLEGLRAGSEACLAQLLSTIQEEGVELAIPTGDSALSFVADHYSRLAQATHLSCPPAQTLRRVLDKIETLEIAGRLGIPIPRTYQAVTLASLRAHPEEFHFPMVAKPKMPGTKAPFKIRNLLSLDQAEKVFEEDPQFGASLLFQEHCPGVGVGIETLIHDGKPVVVFQHRRLSELPARGGVGIVVCAEPVDPELRAMSLELLRALEWQGVAMVEFRHDQNSGRSYLMEVNGRYWGSVSLALHSGVDFPFYDWQIAHGQTPDPPAHTPTGRRARWTAGALKRLDELLTDAEARRSLGTNRSKALLGFLSDLARPNRDMVWSWRDPLPASLELLMTLRELASRNLRVFLPALVRGLLPKVVFRHLQTCRELGFRAGLLYTRLRVLRRAKLPVRRGRLFPRLPETLLFVCHGNILRSPMAAALFRRELERRDMESISVISAGVFSQSGRRADERGIEAAREFGISLEQHRTQRVTPELLEQADVILAMDCLNEVFLLTQFPWARKKVFLLGELVQAHAGGPLEIPDPYSGGVEEVRRCYQSLDRAIPLLTQSLFPTKRA